MSIPHRIAICLRLLGALVAMLLPTAVMTQAASELTLLNWDEYIDPALLTRYEKEYGVRIRLVNFASDDDRTRILLAARGGEFDMALVDGDSVSGYGRRGWLVPIGDLHIPNRDNCHPRWVKAHPTTEKYGVPYLWGTTGIAYRTDLVSTPLTSWRQIFEPERSLEGKIYMPPQSRELIDIGLKAVGASINSHQESDYSRARELLLTQKKHVARYDLPAINKESALITGDIAAAFTYNGDALALQEIDNRIRYVTPEEGGVLWADYLVILSASRQPEKAAHFINWLNEAENAAQLALWGNYASPNREAEKLLPASFLGNEAIYPPQSIVERYELDRELPAHILQLRLTIFAEIVSGKM